MQVLLVIVLSIVEWFGLYDLRGDGSEPALCQNLKEQPSSAYLGNDRSYMLAAAYVEISAAHVS